jgi:hypothetical protein
METFTITAADRAAREDAAQAPTVRQWALFLVDRSPGLVVLVEHAGDPAPERFEVRVTNENGYQRRSSGRRTKRDAEAIFAAELANADDPARAAAMVTTAPTCPDAHDLQTFAGHPAQRHDAHDPTREAEQDAAAFEETQPCPDCGQPWTAHDATSCPAPDDADGDDAPMSERFYRSVA